MEPTCLLTTPVLPLMNTPERPVVDPTIRTPTREENEEPEKCYQPKSPVDKLIEKLPIVDQYFTVHRKIGEGTFSHVFVASCKLLKDRKKFAIKHLTPTSHPSRIIQEMKCLKDIGGRDNVVGLELCLREKDAVAFVMPYFPHDSFSQYVTEMNSRELQLYMKNLLIALRRVHSFNIIHRDVKPSNFLYNRRERKFLLVDFGLSHKVETARSHSHSNPVNIPKVNRKRPLEEVDKEIITSELKRPVLHSLSSNVLECNDRAKLSLKKKSPPFKENSPASKNVIINRNISQVKRNLQFGNITSELKKEVTPFNELKPTKEHTGFNFSATGSSFFRVQNSQIKAQVIFGAVDEDSFRKPASKMRFTLNEHCGCDKKSRICNACVLRKPMHAPRAGTPGYRSPEVLLKYPHQTTAVDIWSAGIIMLSIMSGSYPFFRASDDITALMQIITVFGTDELRNTATKLGRHLLSSEQRKPLKLDRLCEALRRRPVTGKETDAQEIGRKIIHDLENPTAHKTTETKVKTCHSCNQKIIPPEGCLCSDLPVESNRKEENRSKNIDRNLSFPKEAYDLLAKLLTVDPEKRYTADAALRHPFFDMNFPEEFTD